MKEIPNKELIIISYLIETNDLIYFNNSINIRNYIKFVGYMLSKEIYLIIMYIYRKKRKIYSFN